MSRIKRVKTTKQYLPIFYYFFLGFLIFITVYFYYFVYTEKRDIITIIGVNIALFAFVINTYNLIINSRQFKLKNTLYQTLRHALISNYTFYKKKYKNVPFTCNKPH